MRSKWESMEGRQVGSWQLVSFLGERGGRAFFLTTNLTGGGERLMEIVEADSREALELEASWKRAQEIAEPHLLPVYAIERGDIDCEHVQFAVLDLPGDDLGEMLGRRALQPDEARAALSAVARGLEALHHRGLQHGSVTPPNIFLVNGSYRLGVDSIAPETEGGIEEDMRQLGATVVQVMTGTAIADVTDAAAVVDAAAKLRPPFQDIAVGCLNGAYDRKWTASRVLETLSDRVAPQHAAEAFEPRPSGHRSPRLIAAALLAMMSLGALYFVVSRKPPKAIEPDHYRPAVATVSVPQPRLSEARVPDPANPEPVGSKANSKDRKMLDATRDSWGVIAATYTSFHAAQKRAEAIEKRAPQLHPSIFPHDPEGKHFYVILGSGLTEDAAARLRKRAIEHGAPGDSYVTKLDAR